MIFLILFLYLILGFIVASIASKIDGFLECEHFVIIWLFWPITLSLAAISMYMKRIRK